MNNIQSNAARQITANSPHRLPKTRKNVQGKTGRYRPKAVSAESRGTGVVVRRAARKLSPVEPRQKIISLIPNETHPQEAHPKDDVTLSSMIEHWLHTEKYGYVRRTSYDRMETVYLHQIKPYIGDLLLKEITKADCRLLLQRVMEKGYSMSVLKKTATTLKEFFNYIADEDPDFRSPMIGIRSFKEEFVQQHQAELRLDRDRALEKLENGQPLTAEEREFLSSKILLRDGKDELPVLTKEEIQKLHDTIENGYSRQWTSVNGNPIETSPKDFKQAEFFLFLLNTGLRIGEARALRYSDIDFDAHTVSVCRNRSRTLRRDEAGNRVGGTVCQEGRPKTKSSSRVLYLSRAALGYLEKLRAQEPEGYDGYIANIKGRPLCDNTLRKRFSILLHNAGIRHCGLHTLRHTFASFFYEYTNGNQKLVADYLGHSISNITERIYVTISDRFMEEAIRDFAL